MLKSICKFLVSLLWIGLLIIISCYLALTIIYSKNYYQQVYVNTPTSMLFNIKVIEEANLPANEGTEFFLTMELVKWYKYQLDEPWTFTLLNRLGFLVDKTTICEIQQYRLANPLDRTTVDEGLIDLWQFILVIDCNKGD